MEPPRARSLVAPTLYTIRQVRGYFLAAAGSADTRSIYPVGNEPYRVRFTVTVDPTIFWPLYGELHPETVRESEACARRGSSPAPPGRRAPATK